MNPDGATSSRSQRSQREAGTAASVQSPPVAGLAARAGRELDGRERVAPGGSFGMLENSSDQDLHIVGVRWVCQPRQIHLCEGRCCEIKTSIEVVQDGVIYPFGLFTLRRDHLHVLVSESFCRTFYRRFWLDKCAVALHQRMQYFQQ